LIPTFDDDDEVHPAALVTVYVYVPVASPVIVELIPVPVEIVPPGVLVNVHVPDAGKPFKTTLPVAKAHVGCVIIPTVGAVGVAGCALITTSADAAEVHPAVLVTVQVYVPAESPVIVDVVPVPVEVVPPGVLVNVQVPVAGKPFKTTLPVDTTHVGWVMTPAKGAVGVAGCVLMTTLTDGNEIHPSALVTV
jgi:hypothetical protein